MQIDFPDTMGSAHAVSRSKPNAFFASLADIDFIVNSVNRLELFWP